MEHVNDADEAGRAEGDRRGTAKNFDAIETEQVERRCRRIERSAVRDTVYHEQVGVEFGESLHCHGTAARPLIASGQHLDSSGLAQCPTKVRCSAVSRGLP